MIIIIIVSSRRRAGKQAMSDYTKHHDKCEETEEQDCSEAPALTPLAEDASDQEVFKWIMENKVFSITELFGEDPK